MGKAHGEMVAATIRTIFAQPDPDAARAYPRQVDDSLASRFPDVAHAMVDAEDDLLATPPSPERTGGASGPPTRWSA
jgi:putative transposase